MEHWAASQVEIQGVVWMDLENKVMVDNLEVVVKVVEETIKVMEPVVIAVVLTRMDQTKNALGGKEQYWLWVGPFIQ